jgi:hypothetical protein
MNAEKERVIAPEPPNPLDAQKLFQGKITTTENLLTPELREKVRRVILYCNLPQVTTPLMHMAPFIKHLPRAFPNAHFIDTSGSCSGRCLNNALQQKNQYLQTSGIDIRKGLGQ